MSKQKWEYEVFNTGKSDCLPKNKLYSMAEEGWKFAGSLPSGDIVFERPYIIPRQQKEKDPIKWTIKNGFEGITKDDKKNWGETYSQSDIDQELAKMHQWLISNPLKARKILWRKFITGWFNRNYAPSKQQTPQVVLSTTRPMTNEEYDEIHGESSPAEQADSC